MIHKIIVIPFKLAYSLIVIGGGVGFQLFKFKRTNGDIQSRPVKAFNINEHLTSAVCEKTSLPEFSLI